VPCSSCVHDLHGTEAGQQQSVKNIGLSDVFYGNVGAYAQSNMNKHALRFVLCIVLAISLFAIIYYIIDANDKGIRISRYVPAALLPNVSCPSLPADETNGKTNSTTCVSGRPCTYPDVVDFRVIVITFNRAVSLSKLLRSLDTLVLDGQRAALEIWIDRDRKKNVDQQTLEVASAFQWKGGPTRVHVQVELHCMYL